MQISWRGGGLGGAQRPPSSTANKWKSKNKKRKDNSCQSRKATKAKSRKTKTQKAEKQKNKTAAEAAKAEKHRKAINAEKQQKQKSSRSIKATKASKANKNNIQQKKRPSVFNWFRLLVIVLVDQKWPLSLLAKRRCLPCSEHLAPSGCECSSDPQWCPSWQPASPSQPDWLPQTIQPSSSCCCWSPKRRSGEGWRS